MRKVFASILFISAMSFGLVPQPAQAWTKSDSIAAIHAAFPAHAVPRAIRIAKCESQLRAHAINHKNKNGTKDYGLFQLNSGGTMQSLGVNARTAMDPYVNARAAAKLYRQRGWRPWVCNRLV